MDFFFFALNECEVLSSYQVSDVRSSTREMIFFPGISFQIKNFLKPKEIKYFSFFFQKHNDEKKDPDNLIKSMKEEQKV